MEINNQELTLDISEALKFVSDENQLRVSIPIFLKESLEPATRGIYQCIQDQNWEQVRHHSHYLKSSCRYIGAMPLGDTSSQIQDLMDRYFSERDYAVENGINIDKIILLDKKKLDDVFKIFIRQSEELYNRICEYFQLPKTQFADFFKEIKNVQQPAQQPEIQQKQVSMNEPKQINQQVRQAEQRQPEVQQKAVNALKKMREEDSKQVVNFASARSVHSNGDEHISNSRANLTQISICKIPPPIVYQPAHNLQMGLELEESNLLDAYDELNKEWRCIVI